MQHRLTKMHGFELSLTVDDRARASGIWQYGLKPLVHLAGGVGSALGSLADRLSPAPTVEEVRPFPENPTAEQQQVIDKVKQHEWYHTIDLGNAILTPGRFNHLPLVNDYSLPERLDGKRCLDVATMNGFWAFEMEKRGASEVIALDVDKVGNLDIPPRVRAGMTQVQLNEVCGKPFHTAKEILGSNVRREPMNVYDLSPERLGKFDFVFCGDLLLHLINPLAAANNIYRVTDGEALFVDCFSPHLGKKAMLYQSAVQSTWWGISLGALEQIIHDAGFDDIKLLNKFKADSQPGQNAWMCRAAFQARP